MSALSSVTSQALFQSPKSGSSIDARFGVIEKCIADSVKNGDISQEAGATLAKALSEVQQSLEQAARSGGISPYSPNDISELFSGLRQALAAAKQPATAPSSGGVDITV